MMLMIMRITIMVIMIIGKIRIMIKVIMTIAIMVIIK